MTIDPSKIPGLNIDVESIRSGASDLSAQAGPMRSSGAAVRSTWAGMSGCYQAPEQETLYVAMDPVEMLSGALADDLESAASALNVFADAAEAIKADAVKLRGEAQDFLNTTGADPEWMYDHENVKTHTGLMDAAGALQVRLWDAERECANTIRELDGLGGYHADQRNRGDDLFYGMSSIPSGASGLPWGDAVQRQDHCPKKAYVSLTLAQNEVFTDTINGLTTLFGVSIGDANGIRFSCSGKTAAAAWQGLASLAGFKWDEFGDYKGWSLGHAGGAWLGAAKGLVAWDMWKEDPLRAYVTGQLNGVVIAAGIAAGGAGAAAKVGTAGSAGSAMARGSALGRLARVAAIADKVLDPVGTAVGAGVSKVVTWAARTTGIHVNLRGLVESWHRPVDIDAPHVDVPSTHPRSGIDADSAGRIELPEATGHAPSAHGPHAPDARAGVDSAAPDARASVGDGAGAPSASESHAPGSRPGGEADVDAGTPHTHGEQPHGGADASDPSGSGGGERGTGDPVDGAGQPDASRDAFNEAHRPNVSHSVDVDADHALAPSPRKPFGRNVALEPETVYHVEGRGDFYTDGTGRIVHVEANSAATNGGVINQDLNHPLPNATYTVDGRFHYTTDEYARTVRCQVDRLELAEDGGVRKLHIQNMVGHYGDDLPGTYEGGHLIATQYGGPPESINIVPQLEDVNRGSATANGGQGSFKTFETANRSTPFSNIDIEVAYNDGYTGVPIDEVPYEISIRALMETGENFERVFENR